MVCKSDCALCLVYRPTRCIATYQTTSQKRNIMSERISKIHKIVYSRTPVPVQRRNSISTGDCWCGCRVSSIVALSAAAFSSASVVTRASQPPVPPLTVPRHHVESLPVTLQEYVRLSQFSFGVGFCSVGFSLKLGKFFTIFCVKSVVNKIFLKG